MDADLAQVASFENAFAAEQARIVLAENGISAFIDGANANTALSHVGTALGGVRLFVRGGDLAAAYELLEAISAESEKTYPPWFCGNCQEEVDAGFERCWSCGRHREEVEQPFPSAPATTTASVEESDSNSEAPVASIDQKSNPYAPPQSDTHQRHQVDEHTSIDARVEAMLLRAWRASIIGIVLFPPLLHLYSMYLLIRAGAITNQFSTAGTRRYYAALLVNLIAGPGLSLAWLRMM